MKNILLLFLISWVSFQIKAQSKFVVGIEPALTFSSMNYHDAPGLGILEPYQNYYGDWIMQNPISGHFSLLPNISLGLNTSYSFNKKLAWWNSLSFFARSMKAGHTATLGYVGLTSLLQYKPLNKLPKFYLIGGARLDYMLDFDGGEANRILNYSEKTYELSPLIGVGYEIVNQSWFQLTTDIRFNPGFKNLLGSAPWQGQKRYDSYAYNQTFWLTFNFWFKKKDKK